MIRLGKITALMLVIVTFAAALQESSAGDGSTCVEAETTSLYTLINDMRTKLAQSTVYTKLTSIETQVSSSTNWTLADGTTVTAPSKTIVTQIKSRIAATKQDSLQALVWKEGLASAATSLADAWATSGTASLTQSASSTTKSRVQAFGEWKPLGLTSFSELTYLPNELVVWGTKPSQKLSGMDSLILLLMQSTTIQDALLSDGYSSIGAVIKKDGEAPSTPPEWIIDVVVSKTFQNKQGTRPCKAEQWFGEGICKPADRDIELFNMINTLRAKPNDVSFINALDAIIASFGKDDKKLETSYDYEENGLPLTRTTKEGAAAVTEAKTFLQSAAVNPAYTWEAGAYRAARIQMEQIQTLTELTTRGPPDEPTFKERLSNYGNSSLGVELLSKGKNSALNTVLALVIGDGDEKRTARTSIFDATKDKIAISSGKHETLEQIEVLVLVNSKTYKTVSPYSECTGRIKRTVTFPFDAAIMLKASASILAISLATLAHFF